MLSLLPASNHGAIQMSDGITQLDSMHSTGTRKQRTAVAFFVPY